MSSENQANSSTITAVTFNSSGWKGKALLCGSADSWDAMRSVMNMQATSTQSLATHIDGFLQEIARPTLPQLTSPLVGHLFLHTLEPNRSEYQRAGVHYLSNSNAEASWNDLAGHLLGVERARASMSRMKLTEKGAPTSIKSPQPAASPLSESSKASKSGSHLPTTAQDGSETSRPPTAGSGGATRPSLENLLIPQEPKSDRWDSTRPPLAGFSAEEMAAIDIMMGFRRG